MNLIILLLNAGSSSLKFQVIDMVCEKVLIKGTCEKINSRKSLIRSRSFAGVEFIRQYDELVDHKDAVYHIKEIITDSKYGVIKDFSEVSVIGHRVVHGGEYFKDAVLIDGDVIEKIRDLIVLAPLHNQANLNVILICRELFGDKISQAAVFDTSFYFGMPQKAYMYGLPYRYYEKYNIRKYGFHGTSHKFVGEKCAEIMNQKIEDLKIITCHLGNGSSITAIDRGKAVDTSMGFTPLDGLIMGTRCGSLDPSIVTFIEEKENLSPEKMDSILNKESGFLGISGVSNDDREVLESAKNGDERSALSQEMFDYQIIKYIGAYAAAMNGCDAIVFTAGIGENQWGHRENVCESLSFMGVELDKKVNREMIFGKCGKISSPKSAVEVFVIAANEELAMARYIQKIFTK